MGAAAVALLAHQGGWDEALFVAVPVVVLIGLLWLAQRRVAREELSRHDQGDHEPHPS